MTTERETQAPSFMAAYAGIGRGPLEARCWAAEEKLRQAREALTVGDGDTLRAILGIR